LRKKQTILTPSTFSKCSSLTTNPMMLKFGENLLHLLNENYFKFDTNPMVDLVGFGRNNYEIKLQRFCHGNPSMLISCTHVFHEQHLSTHKN